ncbi:MAG: M23 family metallopeptidase [Deltaproteobacteria bacterium]|nr:M23 family metallopeptidase [Deltaproteobacteria bacterium]
MNGTERDTGSAVRRVILAALAALSLFLAAVFAVSPGAFSDNDTPASMTLRPSAAPARPDASSPAPPTPEVKRYDFRIDERQTFGNIMSLFGASPGGASAIVNACRPICDLRLLQKGALIRVWAAGGAWRSIEYRFSPFEVLNVSADAASAGGVRAWKSEMPHETRLVKVSGTIESSLYEAGTRAGADPGAVMDLSDIFAWDVDFASDIKKGDGFAVLYEALYVEGRPVKTGRVIGARMRGNGKTFTAVSFEDKDGRPRYYNADGESLSRTLLKSPLRYRRISSYFSKGRFHPILKVFRPHHGIDYAAPTGTPVESAGAGRVTFAGWKNGYGNFIEIKHPNSYATGYGHLSRIRRGIRPGATVEQGTVIGYVGSTGISTGPHLHYEIRKAGALVNPLGIKSEPARGVAKEELPRFAALRDEIDRRLNLPDGVAVESAQRWKGLAGMTASAR